MTCENCGRDYDPIRYRWLCPHCGWKASCCEGEPAVAPRRTIRSVVMRFGTECTDCARCDEPLIRFEQGAWEHFDSRLDADHDPDPELEPLTERQAEQQLEVWREDVPAHSSVSLYEHVEPRKEFL